MNYNRKIRLYDESDTPERLKYYFDNINIEGKKKFFHPMHLYSHILQCKTMANLCNVKNILEIGSGGSVVMPIMRHLGYNYKTMDGDKNVNPDYYEELQTLNANKYKDMFDLVACFQILEHRPYNEFITYLEKMAIMSKKYILMSLPYYCRQFSISLKTPWGRNHNFKKIFDGKGEQRKYREEYKKEFPYAIHYWEINRKGTEKEKVLNDIRKKLKIIKTFHSENPYHFFILCEK